MKKTSLGCFFYKQKLLLNVRKQVVREKDRANERQKKREEGEKERKKTSLDNKNIIQHK